MACMYGHGGHAETLYRATFWGRSSSVEISVMEDVLKPYSHGSHCVCSFEPAVSPPLKDSWYLDVLQ